MDPRTADEAVQLLETAMWGVATVLSAWYALGIGAAIVARLSRWRPRLWWSPAIARRIAGITCSASFVLAAPHAAHATERQLAGAAVADEPVVRGLETPAPEAVQAPLSPPAPVSRNPAPRNYVVASGDNLWAIAQHQVGNGAPERDVARYWIALITANRQTLRSGNPNLIFPGEAIVLPPV